MIATAPVCKAEATSALVGGQPLAPNEGGRATRERAAAVTRQHSDKISENQEAMGGARDCAADQM
jgi:hypothetical protein